jgi:hypothetical protein
VLESLDRVTEKEPELLVIDTDPPEENAFAGELKSELLIVPDICSIVQYNVPVPKSVVVIVNVTVPPSFTEVVFGEIE